MQRKADLFLLPTEKFDVGCLKSVDCLLVDEAQFLSKSNIDQLREVVDKMGISVICFGLRTDFRTQLFEGRL